MSRALWLVLALCAAGCATQAPEGPASGAGAIVGDAGTPRNRARVHTELATLYYARGNMGVALDEARVAVAADASYATAHGVLGLVYMELRENDLARQSFERALSHAAEDPDINHNYGWFLCQTGRESDSIKYFLQAVRNPLYPAPWRSYSAAGLCTMRTDAAGKQKDAETYFERALRLEPDEPTSLLNLAQIRYRQGNVGDARKMVARHNKVVTPSSESLWLALRIERKLGDRTAEQAYANQLRRRFPESREYQALVRGQYD